MLFGKNNGDRDTGLVGALVKNLHIYMQIFIMGTYQGKEIIKKE